MRTFNHLTQEERYHIYLTIMKKKAASPRKMKDAVREAAGRGRSNF